MADASMLMSVEGIGGMGFVSKLLDKQMLKTRCFHKKVIIFLKYCKGEKICISIYYLVLPM